MNVACPIKTERTGNENQMKESDMMRAAELGNKAL